jgi:hypothetical protein
MLRVRWNTPDGGFNFRGCFDARDTVRNNVHSIIAVGAKVDFKDIRPEQSDESEPSDLVIGGFENVKRLDDGIEIPFQKDFDNSNL